MRPPTTKGTYHGDFPNGVASDHPWSQQRRLNLCQELIWYLSCSMSRMNALFRLVDKLSELSCEARRRSRAPCLFLTAACPCTYVGQSTLSKEVLSHDSWRFIPMPKSSCFLYLKVEAAKSRLAGWHCWEASSQVVWWRTTKLSEGSQ